MKNRSLIKYFAPAVALGVFAFLMMAYSSAYTPPRPSKQRIVCYKFKQNTPAEVIKQHIADYKVLKSQVPCIVEYSAGTVKDGEEANSEYEIVHRLTFRTEEDIQKFKNSVEYKTFVNDHQANWEKVLVINAEID